MKSDLPTRIEQAYARCKLFPEKTADGFMALLELRNLVPEVLLALAELEKK